MRERALLRCATGPIFALHHAIIRSWGAEGDAVALIIATHARKCAAPRNEGSGRLLTVEEVAALLHVPVSWVYGRMRKRSLERLPAHRLGKYWRFREEEIDAWVASRHGGPHAT